MEQARNLTTSGATMEPRVITIALISGTRVRCTARDIWAVLLDVHSVVFFLIAGVIFGYLYPSDHLTSLEWWKQAESILVAIVILIFTLGMLLSGFAVASRWVDWLIAPVPVLLMISVAIMETLCRPIAHWTWNARWLSNPELVRLISTNYIIFLSFEIFFSVFVFRATQRGMYLLGRSATVRPAEPSHSVAHRDAPPEATHSKMTEGALTAEYLKVAPKRDDKTDGADSEPLEAEFQMVQIASERVSIRDLRMVRAEEHYVRITTIKGEKLLRCRFSDAIMHLPDSEGLQVHRSFWLSYNAIAGTARLADGRLLVTLWNQKTVTVPRARKQQLEEALEKMRR